MSRCVRRIGPFKFRGAYNAIVLPADLTAATLRAALYALAAWTGRESAGALGCLG
ncbi:hypothetical protein ACGFJ7_05780 [Actinoplanes sp. NPDC048988]|uniref:hypothetical protein n=1 Tax=Actinoplanes sp. NPDC048988 TaxID=3363901 RepID=UPI00370FDBDF